MSYGALLLFYLRVLSSKKIAHYEHKKNRRGLAKGSLTASQHGRKSRKANCMKMSSRPVPPNDTKPELPTSREYRNITGRTNILGGSVRPGPNLAGRVDPGMNTNIPTINANMLGFPLGTLNFFTVL